MDEIILFLGVIGFFVVFMIIKSISKFRFCVICASVSSTWLLLFLAYLFGYYNNTNLLGVFMGGSSVGIYYLLEKKLPEKYHLFRLPFLLSAFAGVMFVLSMLQFKNIYTIFLILLFLWVVFGIIYMQRTNKKIKILFNKIVACCRDW